MLGRAALPAPTPHACRPETTSRPFVARRLRIPLGIFIAITEPTTRIDELARAVGARGFESLWAPDFPHAPVHRRTPLPSYLRAPGAGDEQPPHRSHIFDPFITLTGAAAVTQTLKLGTGICLLIQRDTIMTAKAVACLDQLSGGRVLFVLRGAEHSRA